MLLRSIFGVMGEMAAASGIQVMSKLRLSNVMAPSRIELLRQRALAQGVLNVDEGPVEENLVRLEAERSGVSYEALCDTIEELLDGDDPWTPTS